jgi:hypothetical protein
MQERISVAANGAAWLMIVTAACSACAGSGGHKAGGVASEGGPKARSAATTSPNYRSGLTSPAGSQAASSSTSTLTAPPPGFHERPVPPEKSPPGDIPDTQVFVKFQSTTGGYQVDVPEGWARSTRNSSATFSDKFDGLSVSVQQAAMAPTISSVEASQVPQMVRSGRALTLVGVQAAKLQGGAVVRIDFTDNSEPSPITNKQLRLEESSYLFYRNGRQATLTVWAPLGSDNVDQWNRISNSFRWR